MIVSNFGSDELGFLEKYHEKFSKNYAHCFCDNWKLTRSRRTGEMRSQETRPFSIEISWDFDKNLDVPLIGLMI